MTATELYNIVKDWPREAWPERAAIAEPANEYSQWYNTRTDELVDSDDAILMFEASGLRWLMKRHNMVRVFEPCKDYPWFAVIAAGYKAKKGDTLIHAIAAALAAEGSNK